MMFLGSLLYLILIGGIIMGAAVLIKRQAGGILRGKRINWLLSGYLVILIAATIFSYTLPSERAFQGEVLTDKELKKEQEEKGKFMTLARGGKIHEAEGAVLLKDWEFSLDGKELTVPVSNSNYYLPVLVEIKEAEDGVVEAAHFTTKSFISNVDVTSEINSPSIEIKDGTFRMYPPAPIDLKLAKFSQPLPFHQFSEDYTSMFGDLDPFHGSEVIYLKVPSDIIVNGNVEYVDS
ncbi:hypothetical protein [Bacillus sp. AK031]